MNKRDALRHALSGKVLVRSFVVGLIVGTILNLINQGGTILSGGEVIWWRAGLTYCVPFCVSTYGAYGALRSEA